MTNIDNNKPIDMNRWALLKLWASTLDHKKYTDILYMSAIKVDDTRKMLFTNLEWKKFREVAYGTSGIIGIFEGLRLWTFNGKLETQKTGYIDELVSQRKYYIDKLTSQGKYYNKRLEDQKEQHDFQMSEQQKRHDFQMASQKEQHDFQINILMNEIRELKVEIKDIKSHRWW